MSAAPSLSVGQMTPSGYKVRFIGQFWPLRLPDSVWLCSGGSNRPEREAVDCSDSWCVRGVEAGLFECVGHELRTHCRGEGQPLSQLLIAFGLARSSELSAVQRNARWMYTFKLAEHDKAETVELTIWDNDPDKANFFGRVKLPLGTIGSVVDDKTFTLQKRSLMSKVNGELRLRMQVRAHLLHSPPVFATCPCVCRKRRSARSRIMCLKRKSSTHRAQCRLSRRRLLPTPDHHALALVRLWSASHRVARHVSRHRHAARRAGPVQPMLKAMRVRGPPCPQQVHGPRRAARARGIRRPLHPHRRLLCSRRPQPLKSHDRSQMHHSALIVTHRRASGR